MSTKVLLFGTFDHLHPGHRFVFEQALKRGDVSVIVARDKNVEKIKGRRPEQSETERKRAIEQTYPSVTVTLGNHDDFLRPVLNIKPDLILLGYDQRMPPGVSEADLPCPVERLEAFEPERHKSSLRRGQ